MNSVKDSVPLVKLPIGVPGTEATGVHTCAVARAEPEITSTWFWPAPVFANVPLMMLEPLRHTPQVPPLVSITLLMKTMVPAEALYLYAPTSTPLPLLAPQVASASSEPYTYTPPG